VTAQAPATGPQATERYERTNALERSRVLVQPASASRGFIEDIEGSLADPANGVIEASGTLMRVGEVSGDRPRDQLLTRGRWLEAATLGWNVVGVLVLAYAAITARSVALAGFGLDSLIEIGASTVVLWELADVNVERRRKAMRLIGAAFVALAIFLGVQSTIVLIIGFHPHHSLLGIAWTGVTAAVMFSLAYGKAHTGAALDNPVLLAEGRITMIDGILATAVLVGLTLNALAGWWWADPVAGYVLLYYAVREARESLR
jgi:Cation efflux family